MPLPEVGLPIPAPRALLTAALCLALGLPACTGKPADSSSGARAAPDEFPIAIDLRLGAEGGAAPEPFDDPRGIAVDGAGRIFVVDRPTGEIRVYRPDGTLLRRFGRQGAGPGEFSDPIGLVLDRSEHLWVIDQGNVRVTLFDTSGALLKTFPRSFAASNVDWWQGKVDTMGRLIDVVPERMEMQGTTLLLLPTPGRLPTDSLVLPSWEVPAFELVGKNSVTRAWVPFAPRLEWALDPAGNVWLGENSRYRIAKLSWGGDTLATVDRSGSPEPVAAAARARAVERLQWFVRQGGVVDEGRIPSTMPMFRRLFADDQARLWVQLNAHTAENVDVFDVFAPDGRFLHRVAGPLGEFLQAPMVVRGYLYAVVVDSLGAPSVVRARVPEL